MNESVSTQSVENVEAEPAEAINNILNLIAQIKIENYDSFKFITEDNVSEFGNDMKVIEAFEKKGFEALQNALNHDEQEKLNNNLKFRDLYGKYILRGKFSTNFFTTACFEHYDEVPFLQYVFRGASSDLAKAGKRTEDKKDDGYVYTDELNSSEAYLIMYNFRLLNDVLCIFEKWQNNNWAYFYNVEQYATESINIFIEDTNNVDEFKVISLLLNKIIYLKNDYNEFFANVLRNIGLDFNYLMQILDAINSVLTSEKKFSLSEDGQVYCYKNGDNFIPKKMCESFFDLRKVWKQQQMEKKVHNLEIVINKIFQLKTEGNEEQNSLNLFNQADLSLFIDENNFIFTNFTNYIKNIANNYEEEIKTFLNQDVFRSRFFKKAFEDEEFLNFILEKDENFKALLECYNENQRLFYNRDITWETKVKVILIKEGEFSKDDTALNIPLKKDEVNRSSVMVRMDKRPELEGDEIVILFELSSRSWWWNRSLCLNLNKESFTKLAKITEKVPNQKEFLDWIYSNRKKLIVKNRGENSNTLVTNFEELAQDAGFFILSENQKKVFDLVPELNREEFKNNFAQHPEFRATVELLGKTITDTKSFVELYGTFIGAMNLLNSVAGFSLIMASLLTKEFVETFMVSWFEQKKSEEKNMSEIYQKIIMEANGSKLGSDLKNYFDEKNIFPQIESQPEVVQI